MVVGKVFRLALLLLVKLPAELLAYLAFNLARILAPGLLVKTIKGKMGEKGMPGKMKDGINSTDDFGPTPVWPLQTVRRLSCFDRHRHLGGVPSVPV